MDRNQIDIDAAPEGDYRPALDEVFDVLSDPHARHTLIYLSDRSDATLETLAEVVTGAEVAETDAVATREDLRRVRIRLYHVVLPKLDDVGYIDFDPDEGSVVKAAVPQAVYSLLGIDD